MNRSNTELEHHTVVAPPVYRWCFDMLVELTTATMQSVSPHTTYLRTGATVRSTIIPWHHQLTAGASICWPSSLSPLCSQSTPTTYLPTDHFAALRPILNFFLPPAKPQKHTS